MKWFDREFAFDVPLSLFPNLLERLRGTPARIEERLKGIERDRIVARPPDGSWSVQENAGHLLDLEPLWRGRVDDFFEGKSELRAADLSNQRTHEGRHNERTIDVILLDFRRAREALVGVLDRTSEEQPGLVSVHPRLRKPMRLINHVLFVAEHDDHHLARITELTKKLEKT